MSETSTVPWDGTSALASRLAKLDKVGDAERDCIDLKDLEILITRLKRISRQQEYRQIFEGFFRSELVQFNLDLGNAVASFNDLIERAKSFALCQRELARPRHLTVVVSTKGKKVPLMQSCQQPKAIGQQKESEVSCG